jgi:hypothetical protein
MSTAIVLGAPTTPAQDAMMYMMTPSIPNLFRAGAADSCHAIARVDEFVQDLPNVYYSMGKNILGIKQVNSKLYGDMNTISTRQKI